jgi:hypothetical protein
VETGSTERPALAAGVAPAPRPAVDHGARVKVGQVFPTPVPVSRMDEWKVSDGRMPSWVHYYTGLDGLEHVGIGWRTDGHHSVLHVSADAFDAIVRAVAASKAGGGMVAIPEPER